MNPSSIRASGRSAQADDDRRSPDQNRWPERRPPRRRGLTRLSVLFLLLLLIGPGYAIASLCPPLDVRWVGGYLAGISLITYAVYARDKRRAEQGEWRTPEFDIHFLELIGGWPAAFLAQRKIRHKSSKVTYQTVFWGIVVIHQYVALDFLLGWEISRRAFLFVQQSGGVVAEWLKRLGA